MTNRLLHQAGWMAALAGILFMSACGGGRGAANQPSPSSSDSPPPSAAMSSPTPHPAPSASAKKTLAEEFIQHASSDIPADQLMSELGRSVAAASPAETDEMLRAMDGYFSRRQSEIEKQFQSDTDQQALSVLNFPVTKEQVDGLKNENLRNRVHQIMEGGYKLETAEGYVFPIVDYAALLKLADGASAAMKDYLTLMAMESDNSSASDGGLTISLDELLQRVLAAETYAKQYPSEPEHAKVEQAFVNYLHMYLVGLDNSPIFNYETFRVLPDVKSHFEKTAAGHPGTVTAKLTGELLDILATTKGAVFLKGKDGMQADIPEVKAFRDSIEKKAKEALHSSGT